MKISRLGRSTEPMTTICGCRVATADASVLIWSFVVAGCWTAGYTVLSPCAGSWAWVASTGGSAHGSSLAGYAAVIRWLGGSVSTHLANGSISLAAGTLTLN